MSSFAFSAAVAAKPLSVRRGLPVSGGVTAAGAAEAVSKEVVEEVLIGIVGVAAFILGTLILGGNRLLVGRDGIPGDIHGQGLALTVMVNSVVSPAE